MRIYDQACGVARALDLLGERWTLLILRDLCGGPWRFSDLLASLSGIGPNLLSKRLRHLVARGWVSHESGDYRLSAAGQSLRPLLRELMAAGLRLPGADNNELLRSVSARITLAVMFDPKQANVGDLAVDARVEDEVFALLVSAGRLQVLSGPCPVAADVTLVASGPGFQAATRGAAAGLFRLRGEAQALRRFRTLFALPVFAV